MEQVGLILEGGGMRGAYTAGVLDFFLQEKLYFESIFGVSAGGCNAISYISRQPGRNLYIYQKYVGDSRYVDPKGLLTRGSVFGMDFIFHEIPEKLVCLDYERYAATQTKLYIVSTDCDTGRPDVRVTTDARDSVDYLMGSSSIPLFSPMVEVDGKKLVDGSASESIPLATALSRGITRPVIVLTRNEGYRKSRSRANRLYAVKYRKYPNLVKSLQQRYITYNASLERCEELERQGRAVILRPSMPLEIDRFEKDPDKLTALYQNGVEDAQRALERIVGLCSDSGGNPLPGFHRYEAEGNGCPFC
ncbi:MAG: patatin family protein [Oscillospiraceae bacterium]|jgi:predicted patatin/cPLA2 family phospholipase|nr:patatin family protein [Oscillospiraceae bacterium]